MTLRWWGPGGSDAADGLSFANRKLTRGGTFTGGFGQPGDVLNLGDGTYRAISAGGTTDTLDLTGITCGGSLGNPFTIQAGQSGQTEGGPLFDGQKVGNAVVMDGFDFITLTGVNGCRGNNNFGAAAVGLFGGNGLQVKRSVFWDAGSGNVSNTTGNVETVRVSLGGRTYNSFNSGANQGVLLEDVATFGVGRYSQGVNQMPNGYATLRRSYARWMFSDETGPKACFNCGYLSGGDVGHYRFENCIGWFTADGWPLQPHSFPVYTNGVQVTTAFNDFIYDPYMCFDNFNNDGYAQHHNIELLGCIGVVSSQCADASRWAGRFGQSHNITVKDHVMLIDPTITTNTQGQSYSTMQPFTLLSAAVPPDLGSTGTSLLAQNVSLFGGYQGAISNQIATAWTRINIFQSAANKGKGATAFGANELIYNTTNGAKILNRYVDGVLTGTNLWPWPMSQRIKDASTTANGGVNSGKFTPPIIDVNADMQAFFGAFPGVTTPVSISPATLPNSQVGSAYSQSLGGVGGTGPYTFTITAGALPTGLSMTSGGVISGTLTAAGTFTFTVTATDSLAATGINSYVVVISSAPVAGAHAFFL